MCLLSKRFPSKAGYEKAHLSCIPITNVSNCLSCMPVLEDAVESGVLYHDCIQALTAIQVPVFT